MLIGGGLGKYNVFVTLVEDDEEVYFTLLDEGKPEGALESIVTGGQLGRFPARTVASIDHAMEAAKHFFERGELAESFTWFRE